MKYCKDSVTHWQKTFGELAWELLLMCALSLLCPFPDNWFTSCDFKICFVTYTGKGKAVWAYSSICFFCSFPRRDLEPIPIPAQRRGETACCPLFFVMITKPSCCNTSIFGIPYWHTCAESYTHPILLLMCCRTYVLFLGAGMYRANCNCPLLYHPKSQFYG